MTDENDAPRTCEACGCELEHEECGACEDGYTPPGALYEEDPLWYDEDDTEPCHQCNGRGGWWFCPECVRRERIARAAPESGGGGAP